MTDQISTEAKARTIVLLPHQEAIKQRAATGDMQWPFYLIWEMGSGKTFGALAAMHALSSTPNARVLVLCPLSLVGQWKSQIQRFMSNCADAPPKVRLTVAHYEQVDRGEVTPRSFDLTVVDEAARFRNAFKTEEDEEGRRPEVLYYEITSILRCPRILYLSGTPILASPKLERRAFDIMMRVAPNHPAHRRVSIYDPREDPEFMRRFAKRDDIAVRVPMLWSQTLLYFVFKRRPMKLTVDGKTLVADQETGNAFETQLVKISNNPFTRPKFEDDDPESSPKIMKLVENVESLIASDRKQLVYSCRKGEGVEQVRYLLTARELSKMFGVDVCWRDVAQTKSAKSPLPNKIAKAARDLLANKFLLLSGDMSSEGRFSVVSMFNHGGGKHRKSKVLHFTQAAANGVDLNEAGDIHLLEPNIIKAMEDQVVARGLRLYAHKKGDKHKFGCHTYVGTFPRATDPVDEENFRDVLGYFRQFRKGGADDLPSATLAKIRDALHAQHVSTERQTVDEKHQADAMQRNTLVKAEVQKLREFDPDGESLLGKKQEAGWSRRSKELSREMKRADTRAREALSRGESTEPTSHGWDGASLCTTAMRFMKDWWSKYLCEDYPGLYDHAWRIVRARYGKEKKPWPSEQSEQADLVRKEVCDEIRLLVGRQHDTLRDKKFYKQVLGRDLTSSDVDAFKRAMIQQGFVIGCNNKRGWKWKSTEKTYKIVPRPGQSGHKELLHCFETECMRASKGKL